MKEGADRASGIDVLRGLSVLLVVLHHAHIRFRIEVPTAALAWPRPLPQIFFWSGYYAVITFFVISGFLITRMALRRWGSLSRIRFADFYFLRFARLAPCLSLLLAILIGLHWAGVPGFVVERVPLARALFAAVGFHVNWLEGRYGYLPGNWDVLWSLSVEEAFYLVYPLLCAVVRRERWLLVPLLSLIVIGPLNRMALAGQSPMEDYAYLSCTDGIAFGCLAALAATRFELTPAIRRIALGVGLAATVLVVGFRQTTATLGLIDVGLNVSLLEAGIAALLLVFGTGDGKPWRGTALLRAIGRASYEIYLTHMFVVLAAMAAFQRSARGSALPWYATMLVASVALGLLVQRAYSEPLNRALRARYFQKRAQPAPQQPD